MKKISIIMAAIVISAAATAQAWTVDKAHSKVGFTVTHLKVNEVDGLFKTFDASIKSSKPDFSDAVFSFTAQASSIFTDNDKRDAHLRSPDFFDAEKNPTLAFQSKSMEKISADKFRLTGDLTMHGVTKTVVLEGLFRGPITSPMNNKPLVGLKISGKINRSDFKLGSTLPAEIVGDEVIVEAKCEFQKD